MTAPLATSTRRGLVLTLYAEGLLVAGALAFVALPDQPRLLVWGVGLSLLLGLPGGWLVVAGRREFGMGHARFVGRAVLVFALVLLALALAYFEVTSVFPGKCEPDDDPDEDVCELQDLRAPWFFLGAALVLDSIGIALALWWLAGSRGRRLLWATLVLGAAGATVHFWRGWSVLEDYLRRSGGTTLIPAEAASYVRDFEHDILRWWALALVAIRIAYLPALYLSISNVAEAEAEAAEATAWTPGEPAGVAASPPRGPPP